MSRLTSPVWNAAERRPRAGLRLLVAFVLLGATSLAATVATGPVWALLGVAPPASTTLDALQLAVFAPGQLIATLVAVVLLARYVDRRSVREYGLHVDRAWLADLGFGLALGGALQTGVFLVELGAGWTRITGVAVSSVSGVSFATLLAGAVVGSVAVGVYEELFARGVLLRNAAEGLDGLGPVAGVGPIGTRGAAAGGVLVSAVVFGGLHGLNPNATLVSTAALVFAGVFLAAGYVLTGELAIPIGIHVTWNLFQGAVWGFPVSGASFGVSVVGLEVTGPRLFTGGAFGPEAGLLGLAAMVVGIVATGAWVRWRGGDLAVAPGLTTPTLTWRK